MPELPEVETVCRGLRGYLPGRVLTRVEARRPDLRFPLPADFAARLTGRRVASVERRAKYILVRFEGGLVWLAHLGMSGRMVVTQGRPNALDPHDHVVVETDAGAVIRFNDARRFGMMDLAEADQLAAHKLLAGIGPEPLSDAFSPATLQAALDGRTSPIKAALLDQRVVAGIGNIYACEALHMAGLSPRRLALTVKGRRAERLVGAIKTVLARAIEVGGSSLRDHVQPSGELGYFQHEWLVYGREGAACTRHQPPVTIRRIVQSNRSTFYCPTCQR